MKMQMELQGWSQTAEDTYEQNGIEVRLDGDRWYAAISSGDYELDGTFVSNNNWKRVDELSENLHGRFTTDPLKQLDIIWWKTPDRADASSFSINPLCSDVVIADQGSQIKITWRSEFYLAEHEQILNKCDFASLQVRYGGTVIFDC